MSLGITDTTVYSGGPYFVGASQTFTLAETGGAGGPYQWTAAADNSFLSIPGTSTGTGTTFSVTADLVGVGSGKLLVEVRDLTNGTTFHKVITLPVDPAPAPIHNANYTADLSVDLNGVIYVDASGGAKTITMWTAYNNRFAETTVVKTDASANAVNVVAPGAETMSPAVALTAQWGSKRMRNDGYSKHYGL